MKKIVILLSLLIIPLLISLVSANTGDAGIFFNITNGKLFVGDYYEFANGFNATCTNFTVANFYYDLSNAMICNTTINGSIHTNAITDMNITNSSLYKTDCYIDMNIAKTIPITNQYVTYLRGLNNTCGNDTGSNTFEVVNKNTQGKLDDCLNLNRDITTNLQVCNQKTFDCNNTQQLIVSCTAEKATCQGQITTLQATVDANTKDKTDQQNTRYIFGAVGLAIGILGTLYFKGHIGGPKTRRPEDNYNRGQAA